MDEIENSNSEKNSEIMSDIGAYLKFFREKKGLDLNHISQTTKISRTILKELEACNLSNIPNKSYLIGFVKSYAKEINADVDESLKVLDRTFERLAPPKKEGI